MSPSVGRVVHFTPAVSRFDAPQCALIVRVRAPEPGYDDLHPGRPQLCDLVVMTSLTVEHVNGVPFAEQPTPGHWNWPPRVD